MVFREFTLGYGNKIKQDVLLYKDSRVWWGRLLQYLAFVMIVGESATEARVAISRRDAERVLVEFLQGKVEHPDDCAMRWLEDLLKHHLLQESNDQIEFRHQLIQEYYAAEWLLGLLPSLSNARLQHDYLNYFKWTEPLALMLELVEVEEQAVRVVRLALDVDLKLGARLSGAVKYGFQEMTVELLIREIEERKVARVSAIKLLGEIVSDKAVAPLILALKDSDDEVRSAAAEALGKIGSDKAVAPLILALKDSDDEVRSAAAEALGKIGSDKAVAPLILALKDSGAYVRRIVASSLGEIGSDKAVTPLIRALKDSNLIVRSAAAAALGKIGNDKAVTPLIRALKDSNFFMRRIVASSLGEIGSDRAVTSLIRALKDSNFFMRWKAAKTSCQIDSDKAVILLIRALKDSDDDVRSAEEETLGKIGSDKAVILLIRALKDSDDDVRSAAASSLGKIGSDKAVIPLIRTLKDSDDDVRSAAASLLGKIGSDKAVIPLICTLNDSDVYMRWKASEALNEIAQSNRNLPTLTQQLPHLLNLIPTEASQQSLSVITAIQSRCKYYNYAIAQMTFPPEDKANPTTGNTYIFNKEVGQIVAGDQTVQGDNIATQNRPLTLK